MNAHPTHHALHTTTAAPETVYVGLDNNYKPVHRATTTAEKIAYLTGLAVMWDRNAGEHEASADRWASRGQQVTAARCLDTARGYRAYAEECRAQAAAIVVIE